MPAKRRSANSPDNSQGTVSTAHLAPYQFKPGQSGNPNGRPKNDNLASYIREHTNGGQEVADYFLAKFRQAETDNKTAREKWEAGDWLAAHGFSVPKPDDGSTSTPLAASVFAILIGLKPELLAELNRAAIALSANDVLDVQAVVKEGE